MDLPRIQSAVDAAQQLRLSGVQLPTNDTSRVAFEQALAGVGAQHADAVSALRDVAGDAASFLAFRALFNASQGGEAKGTASSEQARHRMAGRSFGQASMFHPSMFAGIGRDDTSSTLGLGTIFGGDVAGVDVQAGRELLGALATDPNLAAKLLGPGWKVSGHAASASGNDRAARFEVMHESGAKFIVTADVPPSPRGLAPASRPGDRLPSIAFEVVQVDDRLAPAGNSGPQWLSPTQAQPLFEAQQKLADLFGGRLAVRHRDSRPPEPPSKTLRRPIERRDVVDATAHMASRRRE